MAEKNKYDHEAVQELLAWAQDTLKNKIYPGGKFKLTNLQQCQSTGSSVYAYHFSSDCRGFNNCQGDVVAVSISKAQNMGRKACEICY